MRVARTESLKHYSYRTEEAYTNWIKRYIYFHDVRHPAQMGGPEVQAFLTHVAVEGNVAASTQNPCTERSEVRPSARCSFSTAKYCAEICICPSDWIGGCLTHRKPK